MYFKHVYLAMYIRLSVYCLAYYLCGLLLWSQFLLIFVDIVSNHANWNVGHCRFFGNAWRFLCLIDCFFLLNHPVFLFHCDSILVQFIFYFFFIFFIFNLFPLLNPNVAQQTLLLFNIYHSLRLQACQKLFILFWSSLLIISNGEVIIKLRSHYDKMTKSKQSKLKQKKRLFWLWLFV